ncbi:MAG: hypothetical protein C4539_00365 [Ignavibacteriales bacterium]|nr:MAG: hypothetical protein C4539_00365 [Ignavibacteriales bacterium]
MVSRDSEKDLTILKKHVNLLLDFFRENFERRFEYPKDDYFAFMILCFLSKQKEHLNSVLTLIKNESYSDSMIISRNMIEGVGIILWVSLDLQKRALQWKKYSIITDYRMYLKKTHGDKTKIAQVIIERSLNEGYFFLKESYKKTNIQKKNLPADPFRKTWLLDETGQEVKPYKFFDNENKVLYEIYGDMSDWVHWSISRIGARIYRENSEVGFYSSPAQDGCYALSSAFLSMHFIFEVVNKHLNLKLDDKIKQLSDNYKNELIINN